jgi:hypothetical protein
VDETSFTKTVPKSTTAPEVRIGDAERQAAVRQLQQHFSEGRLTWEELDERLARVYEARVDADLTTLFSDLPTLPTPTGVVAPAQPRRRWRPPVDVRLALALGLALAVAFGILNLGSDHHHGGSFFLIFPLVWLFAARGHRGRRPGHPHHHGHGHHNGRS